MKTPKEFIAEARESKQKYSVVSHSIDGDGGFPDDIKVHAHGVSLANAHKHAEKALHHAYIHDFEGDRDRNPTAEVLKHVDVKNSTYHLYAEGYKHEPFFKVHIVKA